MSEQQAAPTTCLHGNFPETCAHCNAWRERFQGRPIITSIGSEVLEWSPSIKPTIEGASSTSKIEALAEYQVARLIAAAPDLLAALKTIVDGTEGIDREARDAAEAAIEKAGGR